MKTQKNNPGSRFFVVIAGLWIVFLSACGQPDAKNEQDERPEYAQGDTIVVRGTLVDTRCYSADRANLGADHPNPVPKDHASAACARFCARQGFPVGLVSGDSDADVWILLSTPPLLSDYMAVTVRIRAVVRSAGVLIPIRVEALTSDGGWTFVV